MLAKRVEQTLEKNSQAYMAEFVQRSRFATALSGIDAAGQFVDTLNANAGHPSVTR